MDKTKILVYHSKGRIHSCHSSNDQHSSNKRKVFNLCLCFYTQIATLCLLHGTGHSGNNYSKLFRVEAKWQVAVWCMWYSGWLPKLQFFALNVHWIRKDVVGERVVWKVARISIVKNV